MEEKDVHTIIVDLIIGICIVGVLTILIKIIGFLLKRLFTFFRL